MNLDQLKLLAVHTMSNLVILDTSNDGCHDNQSLTDDHFALIWTGVLNWLIVINSEVMIERTRRENV